jgi:DNA-binding MarR family transcriptional regulator
VSETQQPGRQPDQQPSELRDRLETSPTLRLVSVAGHLIAQRFARIFGEQDGLSPSGAAVLNVMGWAGRGREKEISSGRVAHAELARRCMITPATLTGVVSTLVKAGYLRRERDAGDRRVVWLTLTESGTERVGQLRDQIREIAASVSASLEPEHEAIIRDFLVELVCRLSAADPGFLPFGAGELMFGPNKVGNGRGGGHGPGGGHGDCQGGDGNGHQAAHHTAHHTAHHAMHVAALDADSAPDSDPAARPRAPGPPAAHGDPSVNVSAASEPGGRLG